MARGARTRVPFRRRREGRTDYRRRLRLLRSGLPRAVIRKSLNQTQVQIVTYEGQGDKIVASAVSVELRDLGWSAGTGNVPAAYLTGLLAGRRAASKGVSQAVLDLGLQDPVYGGRLFAAASGLLDAGVALPHGEGVLPKGDRIQGKHLGEAVTKQFAEVNAKVEAS